MAAEETAEQLGHLVEKIQVVAVAQEQPPELVVVVSSSSASIRRRQHEIRNRN